MGVKMASYLMMRGSVEDIKTAFLVHCQKVSSTTISRQSNNSTIPSLIHYRFTIPQTTLKMFFNTQVAVAALLASR